MADKVKFGIKNVHIFPATNISTPTYAAGIAVPGAVSFSLEAQGEISKFHADNIVYYQSASNNGYEGDLEIARIPDEIFEKIFHYSVDANYVITENSSSEVVPFAMTFEEDGDDSGTKFVLYNCTATRPTRELNTIEENKEPTTQTLTISAAPLTSGDVMAMTGDNTPDATLNAWHNAPYFASASNMFSVTFNSMGGSAVATQYVESGDTVTEPANPTKEGHTFGAWYSDLALTDAWTFATDTVTSDMMLYASWT